MPGKGRKPKFDLIDDQQKGVFDGGNPIIGADRGVGGVETMSAWRDWAITTSSCTM
jgi:hypothetical protein